MLSAKPHTARFLVRQAVLPLTHARPRPALPPISIALSPVFSRHRAYDLTAIRNCRSFSSTPARPVGGKEKVLGVAAALKAQEDAGFEVKPEIFDEFSLQGRVGVVSLRLVPDNSDQHIAKHHQILSIGRYPEETAA